MRIPDTMSVRMPAAKRLHGPLSRCFFGSDVKLIPPAFHLCHHATDLIAGPVDEASALSKRFGSNSGRSNPVAQ